jgi:parvulin-like peptidyl-prolyl isomerase
VNLLARIRARLASRFAAADKSALTNLVFVVVIAATALLFVVSAGYLWWSDTLAPAVEVNGSGISKTEAKGRAEVATFQLDLEESRVRARLAAGTLSPDEATSQLQAITDAKSNIGTSLTSDMIDALLVGSLADEKGVTLDQAAIDASWAAEISTSELRLMRRISLTVAIDQKTLKSDALSLETANAQMKAIKEELAAGVDFGEIAKRLSTDSFAADGGLVGWSSRDEDPQSDTAYKAAWALSAPGLTEPVLHTPGQLVLFQVDQIRPAAEDLGFQQRASDAGVDLGIYKKMVAEKATFRALAAKVTDELLVEPVEQRDLYYVEIASAGADDAEQVVASHILYSPNDAPKDARRLDKADPAWAAAKAEADAAYAKLIAGADFAALAAASDDTQSAKDGGSLGPAKKGAYSKAFDEAVWADGLQPGQILPPVETEYGWHVIRFDGRKPSQLTQLGDLATALAADPANFEFTAQQAVMDIPGLTYKHQGWVARYALNATVAPIVWSVAAGAVSGVQTASGGQNAPDSDFIIYVAAVESRPFTPAQRSAIAGNGFSVWLDQYRSVAKISIDGNVVQEAGASPAP